MGTDKQEQLRRYKARPGEEIVGYTENRIIVKAKDGTIKRRRPKVTDIEGHGDGRKNNPTLQAVEMKKIEETDAKRAYMAKSLNNAYQFYLVGRNKVTNNEELAERVDFFVQKCVESQQLPTIEKLALCLGYTTVTLHKISTGGTDAPAWVTPETVEILKKTRQMIAAMDAELAQEGKIQPVVYMFRAKNYYGMRDQQEIVVSPGTENNYNPEELKEEARLLAESQNKAERKIQNAIEVEAKD